MVDANPSPKLEALLEHGGWVRALARSLVSDSATAEDLEQKTWLAAVERPPRNNHNPKAWLGSVVRNLSGMHWREQKARRRREESAADRYWADRADAETREQPDDLSGRMETFRILAVALGNLEEPYGTTLYLRFFEDLTMREIARRMKVPESTTKARVTRGLEMLRIRLEASLGGEWRAHCLVFTVPLTKVEATTLTTTLITTMKAKVLIAAASIALIPLVYYQPWDSGEKSSIDDNGSDVQPMEVAALDVEQAPQGTITRVDEPIGLPEPKVDAIGAVVRVRVVEQGTGALQRDVKVGLRYSEAGIESKTVAPLLGKANSDGWWSLQVPAGMIDAEFSLQLEKSGGELIQDESIELSQGEVFEHVIAIPHRYDYELTLQGPNQEAIANHPIEVSSSPMGSGLTLSKTYLTDGSGKVNTFFIPGEFEAAVLQVPAGMFPMKYEASLAARDDGFGQTIHLFSSRQVQVQVQDQDRQALPGIAIEGLFYATMLTGGVLIPFDTIERELLTDQDGKATLTLPIDERVRVRATDPRFTTTDAELDAEQRSVTIVLAPGRGMRGRVVGNDGLPVHGAEVRGWVESRTFLRGPRSASEWRVETTDAEGYFEITGFEDQGFASLMVIAEGYAYYGEGWESLPTDFHEMVLAPADSLFGFVHDRNGNAVAGVSVRVQSQPAFGGDSANRGLSYFAGTHKVETAQDGSFEFPGLAHGPYELHLNTAEETVAKVHTGPEPVIVVVGELAPGMVASTFRVLDRTNLSPVPRANISLTRPMPEGGSLSVEYGQTDQQGIFECRALSRDSGFFTIEAEGYLPHGVWMSSLTDGFIEQEILLTQASSFRIRIVSFDGLPLLPADPSSNQKLRVGLVLGDGFLLQPYFSRLSTIPGNLGNYGSAESKNSSFHFPSFPESGGRLLISNGVDEEGFEVAIPFGTEDAEVTLSSTQLKGLGLRD